MTAVALDTGHYSSVISLDGRRDARAGECGHGLKPADYIKHVIVPLLGAAQVRNGLRLYPCPAHDDRRASFSINPGDIAPIVWHCPAGCAKETVRDALIARGACPECLGGFGAPHRPAQPGLRIGGYDAALVADAKRWHAARKLPNDLNAWQMRMCMQALDEGDGDLPGDPWVLLPVDRDLFIALARRAGMDRPNAHRAYKQWMDYESKQKRQRERIVRCGEQ